MPLSEKHDETKTYDDILNAGPPLNQLAKEFVTPTELFFVRNHTQIPHLQLDSYRLRVGGLVTRELSLSIDEIKNNFESHTLIATLQCAGNRRKELVSYKPIDDGLAWGIEAIGTAEWTGVRLGDVLTNGRHQRRRRRPCGFPWLRHAHARRASRSFRQLHSARQSAGLRSPARLRNERRRLATRAWLPAACDRARLYRRAQRQVAQRNQHPAAEPSDNHFQQVGYKLFPPHINMYNVDYHEGMQLTKLPVNSVIVRPEDRSLMSAGRIEVEGYAMSDGEHEITWVTVSPDGGQHVGSAPNSSMSRSYGPGSSGSTEFDLPQGQHEIVVRAWDSAANSVNQRQSPAYGISRAM